MQFHWYHTLLMSYILLLTAVHQSVEGGRIVEAGGSEAAAQTAGTKTLYPAEAHV